jgi:hypothetical protein
MIKQISFARNIFWYRITISYGNSELFILDRESVFDRDNNSNMICLSKWTGMGKSDGIYREKNIEGHMACCVVGVDEI